MNPVRFSVHSPSYLPSVLVLRSRPFPSLGNESYICLVTNLTFRSNYSPIVNFRSSRSPPPLHLRKSLSRLHLPPWSHSHLFTALRIPVSLFLIPRPASLFPRVAVELNRAQQPVLQTKKRFRRCLPRPPPFPFLLLPYSLSLSLTSLLHDCAWFCEGTTSPPSRARAPFLIFPGTIVSA